MSELLIDATGLVDHYKSNFTPTGIERVTLAYMKYFRSRARAFVSLREKKTDLLRKPNILSKDLSQKLFDVLLEASSEKNKRALDFLEEAPRSGSQNLEGYKGAIFFKTDLSGRELPYFADTLRTLQVKPVFLFYDFIPLKIPHLIPKHVTEKHRARLRKVLELANGVITISETVFKEWLEYVRDLNVEMPPTIFARLAPALDETPSTARPIKGQYFVVLGSVELRKNPLLLVDIWQRLVPVLGQKTPKLVFIGRADFHVDLLRPILDSSKQLNEHLIQIENCSDKDLATFLKHARALLFPSHCEGYGLPLVEALSLGVPVIANDLEVFREIAGAVPELIPISDRSRWEKTIMEYLTDGNGLRKLQLQRIQNFTASRWSEHFSKVERFLEKLTEN